MTGKKIRRKIYFMPKSFQGKYVFYFFLLSVFCVFLFSMIFSFMAAGSTSIIYDEYSFKVGATPSILIKQILISNWAFILLGGALTSLFTMLLMHRITGPLYRFEVVLDKMLKGDFTEKIHLRKHDEGKELADKFNEINENLSTGLNEMSLMNDNALEIIETLENNYKEDDVIKQLAQIINKNKKVLNNFKID